MSNYIDLNQLCNDHPETYNTFTKFLCGRSIGIFDKQYPGIIDSSIFTYFMKHKKRKKTNG